NESMLVIADAYADTAIGIAGVKGGTPASISDATTDIIIESANFDGVSVRKTAQALKLRTDASARFEQGISPDLTAYGMRAVVDLILELGGGEVVGYVDSYPTPRTNTPVSVSLSKINKVLGLELTPADVSDVFTRLGFAFTENDSVFAVTPPFERLDILIPEDLIEEVGRIIGYDKVPAIQLPAFSGANEVNPNFYAAEKVREELMSQGYSEVFTSVFAEKGERVVANKVDGVRPYMRTTLVDGLTEALKKNIPNKDLLGLKEIKLFEVGTVWKDGKEIQMIGTVTEKDKATEKPLEAVDANAYENLPISEATRYAPYSRQPYIIRDIAMWTPAGTDPSSVMDLIRTEAGELLQRIALFDTFTKADKTSLAFRLIFQSFEKTLTDEEVNQIMQKVSTALTTKGFEIR
ncbi:hypothetical protein HYT05_00590, partial [Candidatus Kaiserbacteria bacterium]|nr:hypothetical protein [Candidatus Kaiserbacteria bacterium]